MVVLVCTAVCGISRISEYDLLAVNFAKKIPGRKLNGKVIKEIEVKSEDFCAFACVEENRCLSYNFGTIKDDAKRFRCELSDSDRFTGFVNFTKDGNFNYTGLQVFFCYSFT